MKKVIFSTMAIWLAIVCSSLYWNLLDAKREKDTIALETAQAFFSLINYTRAWNAKHQGVYVPISDHAQPNQYLTGPFRDLVTDNGVHLTMINPAYMTRQISEIALESQGIRFHITSLNPIRPQNEAKPWEKKWLQSFENGVTEHGQFFEENGKTVYRYMAPMTVEKPCLPCHQSQGYQEGDIRGGISVTLPYFTKETSTPLWVGYSIAAIGGLLLIATGGILLGRSKKLLVQSNQDLTAEVIERKKAQQLTKLQNEELKEALSKVKLLSGFLPICASCKKIRDDKGYWNQIEAYIGERSEAEFSHGVCPDCAEKLYPGLMAKIDRRKKGA